MLEFIWPICIGAGIILGLAIGIPVRAVFILIGKKATSNIMGTKRLLEAALEEEEKSFLSYLKGGHHKCNVGWVEEGSELIRYAKGSFNECKRLTEEIKKLDRPDLGGDSHDIGGC
jgi:hypothetical protein